MEGDTFPSFFQCFCTVGQTTGRTSACKNWMLVCCWWWQYDYSFARLLDTVVIIISIILSSNKIQNGDILIPAYLDYPRKWPSNECRRCRPCSFPLVLWHCLLGGRKGIQPVKKFRTSNSERLFFVKPLGVLAKPEVISGKIG